MLGHLVEATLDLDPGLCEGRRIPAIAAGNRSLVYQFDSLEAPGTDTGLEGLIEQVESRGVEEVLLIRFLREVAAVYATPGVRFKVWYGGVIGTGTVLEVVE